MVVMKDFPLIRNTFQFIPDDLLKYLTQSVFRRSCYNAHVDGIILSRTLEDLDCLAMSIPA